MPKVDDKHVCQARALLKRAVVGLDEQAQAELAVELAHTLLSASQSLAKREERAQAERLGALMEDEVGQAFATAITDRVHRSKSGSQLVRQVQSLVTTFGIPKSLERLDRLELRALTSFGSSLPELTAAAVKKRIYHDASGYLVPADTAVLTKYLQQMTGQNVRVNVNHLGEEVLGEREAARHLLAYLELLGREEVSTISVKISSLYSQLRPIAWEHCLTLLSDRLRRLYRAALSHSQPKLVYLDMESYRDLGMTVALFKRVLQEPEFASLTAGIVLQAYVPDSVHYQCELTEWAMRRVSAGGAPIRVRIVKGANLAMERLEASERGFPLATYGSKHEVDANYKRLLAYACHPKHAAAVQLGVASHNLFDLSLALVVRRCRGIETNVELEMLEGMAQPLRRALQAVAGSVLVYAPSVDEKNFPAAVAYLVRRLDENTGEDNFLRHSFGMRPGDARFREQAAQFLRAYRARNDVSHTSHRDGERRSLARASARGFVNEPDTDVTNAANRRYLLEALQLAQQQEYELPLLLEGRFCFEAKRKPGFDPSRPAAVPYQYVVADEGLLERVLSSASEAAPRWAREEPSARAALLLKLAGALRSARAELVSHMVLDAGKRVEEADAEVSEAIDFAEYYAAQFLRINECFETSAKGVVLVTPPWNFPLAIPFSGVAAALVAGNSVVLKPAPETVLVASTLARLCHEVGLPKGVLSCVAVEDSLASHLISDRRVAMVVLTGATSTAQLFHRLRPGLDLVAETGGKNAIYVSDVSDQEQACRHIVQSAFSHAGQKCSAQSLLILHRDLYHDDAFKAQLLDAAQSLLVGSAWQVENFVTPLIRPPAGPLLDALGSHGEWLLEARQDIDNPRLVHPGIKYNVRAESALHLTELFGPILGVMQASHVGHAIELINKTPYGLTSGVQSLDAKECLTFVNGVDVGNVYTNHPITGAIVGRQPFGGRKASGFGPGAKAGGPNYVAQFCHVGARRSGIRGPALSRGPRALDLPSLGAAAVESAEHEPLLALASRLPPRDSESLRARFKNYQKCYELEFSRLHPQDDVLGAHHLLRYQPSRVLLLLSARCPELEALFCLLAARIAGAELSVLMSPELGGDVFGALKDQLGDQAQRFEPPSILTEFIRRRRIERVRCPGPVPRDARQLPASLPVSILEGPAHADGWVELRRYLKEQSVSISYHRYGNLRQPEGPLTDLLPSRFPVDPNLRR